MEIKIYIKSDDIFTPIVCDNVIYTSAKSGRASKLEFTVVNDDNKFYEGAHVIFRVDHKDVFYGFVFEKQTDKENKIKVTAYDQLRYLKNKDTYVYKNKTASELLKLICDDFNLRIGDVDNTNVKLSRVEDNKALFDIIYNALDLTLLASGDIFILFDDFGKISLKNVNNMQIDYVLSDKNISNYTYISSIDRDTYNQIKIVYDDKKTKKRSVYVTKDSENINRWGLLQFYSKMQEENKIKSVVDAMIDRKKGKNRKTRLLTLNNVIGNTKVRGGSKILTRLQLEDVPINNYMIVENVQHTFKNNVHLMNLKLMGL